MTRTRTLEAPGSRIVTRDVRVVCWYFCFSVQLVHVFVILGSSELLDIPAHTYQATFEPNKEWSTFYASAPEIHRYWKGVVKKYGCMKYIKLKQQVSALEWDEESFKWKLQVRH